MTWMYPPAFAETFRCDHCLRDFSEDELTEHSHRYWTCAGCAEDLAADENRWTETQYKEAAE